MRLIGWSVSRGHAERPKPPRIVFSAACAKDENAGKKQTPALCSVLLSHVTRRTQSVMRLRFQPERAPAPSYTTLGVLIVSSSHINKRAGSTPVSYSGIEV